MKLDSSLLLALAAAVSSVAAAPAAADDAAAPEAGSAHPPPCITPQVIFTSFPQKFSLGALAAGPSTSQPPLSWPVQLSPREPSEKVTSKPVISQARIAPQKFELVNGTLFGGDGRFPADLSPVITIFPPPLQPFTFGGANNGDTKGKFEARYTCDSTGKQILQLLPAEDTFAGFAVSQVAEGQQIFIKPKAFEDKAVDVTLKINLDQ